MTSNVEALLSRLTGVKKQGKEWIACCPAHPDSTPSLGIRISESGKVLIHCMADCAPADILSAIGMELADLFPDRKLNGHAQPIAKTKSEPGRITCAPGSAAPTPVLTHPTHGKPSMLHVYRTFDNQLLGYVMRFDTKDGKTFSPYTYSKADGWKHKAFSKPRPLYGLERLRLFSGARILVEGEKAADAGQDLAPSNAVLSICGGAGAVKYNDLEPLAGQPVILWPDADEPGRKAMESAAVRLHALGCSLRVVDTAGLPDGFDAADLKEPLRAWLTPRLQPYTPVAVAEPCQPMPELSEAPVARPVASVTPIAEARTRQQAKAQEEPIEYAEFAEDALANGFSERHPELRYVAQWAKWLEWSEAGWQEDTTLHIYDLTRLHCRACAAGNPGAALSSIRKVKSAATRASVENLARSDRRHAALAAQWDADPLLLNTPGGLVDLRNGSTRAPRIDDYCLKITAATPREGCPTWLDFLKWGTDGDSELQAFLQQWAGLNITGLTREQKFVFIHGRGGAGKGTFLNTLARILGTYARKIKMETLTEHGHSASGASHNEDIARLAGARMGYAAETAQGKRWNEARIKELTGEDTINARMPYAPASFEFLPQLKLTIMGNHPPGLRSVGNEMRRRLLIIPFDHLPPVPDLHLAEKLWEERDGILFWALCGAIDWQSDGLRPPASVLKASADYFNNQDVTGQWIADKCETDLPACNFESTIRTLYKSYFDYVHPTGYEPLRQGELRDELHSRGFKRGGYDRAPTIKGLRVRVDTTAHDSRYPD